MGMAPGTAAPAVLQYRTKSQITSPTPLGRILLGIAPGSRGVLQQDQMFAQLDYIHH